MNSKACAYEWAGRASRLSDLNDPYRSRNIAICLASAYRQGWREHEEIEIQNATIASVILRTIYAEAKRTGSWTVPVDIQERLVEMEKEGTL